MFRLILLFITIPLLEVIIYIIMGKYIGIIPTLALIFGTGIAGAILAKQQGFSIISQIRRELHEGVIPGNHVLDGLMVLAGGLLLLTPGLITDVTGFVLITPATRKYIREFMKRKFQKWIRDGKVDYYIRYR